MELDIVREFTVHDYSLDKTVNSGQMFRWSEVEGEYQGISGNKVCRVMQVGNRIVLRAPCMNDIDYWVNLLAFEEDVSEVRELMSSNEFLCKAYEFSRGLRILRQEPWDTAIGFIISQRNNIPRIKMCVEEVAWAAGTQIDDLVWALPTPDQLRYRCLLNCKLGYREGYLYALAEAVRSGELDLQSLQAGVCTSQRALQELTRIRGIGIKVASCIALFGLGHTELFPVDVWIERAMRESGISYTEIGRFGEYAGLVQQYLYYYMLNRNIK